MSLELKMRALPARVQLGILIGLDLLALALAAFYPRALGAVCLWLAIGYTAFTGRDYRVRLGSYAVLILAAMLAFRSKEAGDLYFIAMVAILVALIRVHEAPKWLVAILGAAVLLLAIPGAGFRNTFLFELSIQIGIYAAMALGLNVVVGTAGLLDMGYAAFFAIGAYTWGIFGSPQAANFMKGPFPLNGNLMFLFMFVAIFATAVTGLIIGLPALRLRGDYLAIVTLGLGEVIRVLANNMDHPINFTNGPHGITPVARPDIGWFRALMKSIGVPLDATTDYQFFFYLLVLLVIGAIVAVNINLGKSRFGRAWVAIREDEIAARSMGVPLVRMKLFAFATGAAFSGAMGVLFAAQRTFVSPETFTMLASTTILGMVVLGGMGSIEGAILGAAALTILNIDLLKGFSETLNAWRQQGVHVLGYNLAKLPNQLDPAKFERLIFGIVLILMMIFRPEGLLPERRRAQELHAGEGEGEKP